MTARGRDPAGSREARTGAATFSVIVPTFGRPAFLAEAIDSVLAQTVQDFECIVVDDASPEPVTVVDHPSVRLIRREVNGGPSAARNTGIRAARGRYLAFLDDDDLFGPDRLAIGLQGVARAPIGICWLRPIGKELTRKMWRRYGKGENRQLDGNVHDVIVDRLPPHLGQLTIERTAMLPIDERYRAAEDIDWWIRATERLTVATVPRVGYLLRRHEMPREVWRHGTRIETNLQLLRDHAGYFRSHPRGAARRWRMQARFAERDGDRRMAREALRRSLAASPQPATLLCLARAYLPGVPTGA